jgi:diguanylate cyclase (GGDEF)-like protein
MALPSLSSTPEIERLRQIENERLVRPAARRHVMLCVLVVVAVAITGPADWLVAGAVIVALSAVAVGLVQLALKRTANVGLWMSVENVVIVTMVGAGTVVGGGLSSPAMPVFAVMSAFSGVRFSGVASRLQITMLLVVLTASVLIADPSALTEQPGLLVSWLVGCFAIWNVGGAIGYSEREARSHAVSDALTGLLNRKAFDLRVDSLQDRVARGDAVAIVMCDLDGFKAINDTLGHDAGDDVLRRTADALRASARATDHLYRLGGDEFAVVLDGASADDADEIGERLRAGVERAFAGGPRITLSVGVATARGERLRLDEVVRGADRALYEAKRGGRNAVVAAAVA